MSAKRDPHAQVQPDGDKPAEGVDKARGQATLKTDIPPAERPEAANS